MILNNVTTRLVPDDYDIVAIEHVMCEFCTTAVEHCIALARETGSRDACCTFSGPYDIQHSATVQRS